MSLLSVIRAPANMSKLAVQIQQKRFSGHGREIPIFPSKFQWNKFKDLTHLYFLVGLIPLFSFSAYMNLFVGKAELREIPEGYVPENWEYERHPVTRFLTKYFFYEPISAYELRAAKVSKETDKMLARKTARQVKAVMAENQDYRSFFFQESEEAKLARYNRSKYLALQHGDGSDK